MPSVGEAAQVARWAVVAILVAVSVWIIANSAFNLISGASFRIR